MMSTASSRSARHQSCHPAKSTGKVKRACDLALYAECNLVERFNSLKHYQGIATRHDKTARNFLAGLQLVCGLARLK
jgi:transposase